MKSKTLLIFPDWEVRAHEGFLRDINEVRIAQVFLLNYEDGLHADETKFIVEKIKAHCNQHNIKLTELKLSKIHSIHNWLFLESFLNTLETNEVELYLDITTMPREIIWMLLYNLRKKVPFINYFYHKPDDYNKDWLTQEPDTPRLLFKHSGIMAPDKQTALIIIPGFDCERVSQIINFFDPKEVILGIQIGNQFNNDSRNNGDIFKIEIEQKVIQIDAYSADHGLASIEQEVSRLIENFNIVITSLGPKLTAMSMYKLYQKFPEIALSYIPCKEYNLNYSTGIGDMITGKYLFNA